jgi:hypothetical protein
LFRFLWLAPRYTVGVSLGIAAPALLGLSSLFALLGLVAAVGSGRALRRRRGFAFGLRSLTSLIFAALAALGVLLVLATQGYRGLTREDLAAEVEVAPTGPHSFTARFRFPDGRVTLHHLAGDQLYVDAHILKWKPVANVLGLHTAYQLDRVAGRYASLEDERSQLRTVFSVAEPKRVDLFDLRTKYAPLAFLVDTDYGSATFVNVKAPATLEVRVSTTGLLVRTKRTGP